MIGGVNFQPNDNTTGQARSKPANTGVQEAIQVLSLRLPKVVGARAMAPQALLESPGGNGRVDSVVSQVMARMFPTGDAPPTAPMVPPSSPSAPASMSAPSAPAPSFTGSGVTSTTPLASMVAPEVMAPQVGRAPRIAPVTRPDGSVTLPPDQAPAPNGPTDPGGAPPAVSTDGAGDPMADFVEFLRRNQLTQEPPPPPQTFEV